MDALFTGAFQLVVTSIYLLWFFSYVIPSAQSVYTFDTRYESLSMSAVSLGLFVHSLLQEDVFLIPMIASFTGILAWVQLGTSLNDIRLNPDPNANTFRNVTVNPNAGVTVSLYNTHVALTVLCFFAILWMQAYWLYVFMSIQLGQGKIEYTKDEFTNAWRKTAKRMTAIPDDKWVVSDGYSPDIRRNVLEEPWSRRLLSGLYLGCVVTVMIIALTDYIVFFSANAGQQYLGPIPNSQFGVFFATAVFVRPIGAQPFASKYRFDGRFASWLLGSALLLVAMGISANNVVMRQQYTANQANSVSIIADKSDCYLSDPCYQTLATSTVFYEFTTAVQYTLGFATVPIDWAYWSLFSVLLEITLFSLVTVEFFVVGVAWVGQEILRRPKPAKT